MRAAPRGAVTSSGRKETRMFGMFKKKAQALAQRGELVRILMMPAALGGQDFEPNAIYVPRFAADLKHSVDTNIVLPLARDGKISRYEASPRYEGDSFVPVAIAVKASDPGSFTQVIRIWGSALADS